MLRLAAASGAILVSGCSSGEEAPAPDGPTSSDGATPAPDRGATDSLDQDELRVERAQALLAVLLGQSRAAARGRPGGGAAERLDAVSRRMSERLDALRTDDVPVPTGQTGDRNTAQRRLASGLAAAQGETRRLAGQAASGDLARLLASVGAGLQQDATALANGDTPSLTAARAGLTTSIGADLGQESVLEATQLVLAGEHAAVYAYGVMGGRSPAVEAELATRGFVVHRARRDALTTSVREAGAEPVVAEPGYALPVDVVAPAPARRVGEQIEDRCSVLYATLVAAAPASTTTRQQAVTALSDAGVRLLTWGGEAAALPGVQLP